MPRCTSDQLLRTFFLLVRMFALSSSSGTSNTWKVCFEHACTCLMRLYMWKLEIILNDSMDPPTIRDFRFEWIFKFAGFQVIRSARLQSFHIHIRSCCVQHKYKGSLYAGRIQLIYSVHHQNFEITDLSVDSILVFLLLLGSFVFWRSGGIGDAHACILVGTTRLLTRYGVPLFPFVFLPLCICLYLFPPWSKVESNY